MMTSHKIKPRRDYGERQHPENSLSQFADLRRGPAVLLVSLGNRKTSIDPVRPEVVRNIENFHIGESHRV